MNWRKLDAKFFLGRLFFWHLFKKVVFFWRRHQGLGKFLSVYAADNILPISEQERARMPDYQKCIVCSLCTFSCEAIAKGKAPGNFEPKFLMIGYGRSSHESEYFLEDWMPCHECQQCTVTCPNNVPIHAMAETIIERRKNVAYRRDS